MQDPYYREIACVILVTNVRSLIHFYRYISQN
jgi:hypothetical protein